MGTEPTPIPFTNQETTTMGKSQTTPDPDGPDDSTTSDAAPETVQISFDGEDYTIPATIDHVDWSLLVAYEQGRAVVFLTGLLGPDQMRRFHAKPRRGLDAGDLMAEVNKAWKAAPGE